MKRQKHQTKRERKLTAYEDARAESMERALKGASQLVTFDIETGSLTGRATSQTLPRTTLSQAQSMLAQFRGEYPELSHMLSVGDKLTTTDVDGHVHDMLLVSELEVADYASIERRVMAYTRENAYGLGAIALTDYLQKVGHEPPQEEALRTEIPTLVPQEEQASCGHGARPCWPSEATREGGRLRRAKWFSSIPLGDLAQEHLRAAGSAGRPAEESERVCRKVSEILSPALKPYL